MLRHLKKRCTRHNLANASLSTKVIELKPGGLANCSCGSRFGKQNNIFLGKIISERKFYKKVPRAFEILQMWKGVTSFTVGKRETGRGPFMWRAAGTRTAVLHKIIALLHKINVAFLKGKTEKNIFLCWKQQDILDYCIKEQPLTDWLAAGAYIGHWINSQICQWRPLYMF